MSELTDEFRRALCAIAVVGQIDGHDVIRRESVLDIADRRLAAIGGAPVSAPPSPLLPEQPTSDKANLTSASGVCDLPPATAKRPPLPSFYCPHCGQIVGWLGRAFPRRLHDCDRSRDKKGTQ